MSVKVFIILLRGGDLESDKVYNIYRKNKIIGGKGIHKL